MHQDDVVGPGEVDHALHEGHVDARGGGVVRERQHDDPRLGPRVAVGLLHALEEVGVGADGDLAHVGARQVGPPDVDGVRRRRHQAGVAGLQQHPHEVGEALLGPDGADDLAVGVEGDAEAPLVERGDGLAQLGDAAAGGVAVVAGVAHRFAELVDGHVGRGQVGVAEAEVDDVLAGSPGLDLEPIDDGEDVGRHVRDPAELHPADVSGPGIGPLFHCGRAGGAIMRA